MQFGALVDMPPGDGSDAPAPRQESRHWWPAPALVAWGLSWSAFALTKAVGGPPMLAVALGTAIGVSLSLLGNSRSRRWIIAGGFPLSLIASGAANGLPGWAWLLPLALLALTYPVSAWRDAPLFPTPAGALDGLERSAPLLAGSSVLDAGCGLGHGLEALRRAYPEARLAGVERSWPLAVAAKLRCRWAEIRRGDLWQDTWKDYALVYLFQRPETLPRALAKARAEMTPGAWLASLEFEATELQPQAVLHSASGRPVWLYRAPFIAAGDSCTSPTRGASSPRALRR